MSLTEARMPSLADKIEAQAVKQEETLAEKVVKVVKKISKKKKDE